MNDQQKEFIQKGVPVLTMPIPPKTVAAAAGAGSIMTLFKVPLGAMMLVKATIYAKGVATSQRAAYEVTALLKNIGGTTSVVQATVAGFTAEDTGAWAATLVANDTKDSVDLNVTPDVTVNTIFWGFASAQQV